jgi:hypothetical protein
MCCNVVGSVDGQNNNETVGGGLLATLNLTRSYLTDPLPATPRLLLLDGS